MVNVGVALLVALAVILTIGFIALIVYAGVSFATDHNSNTGNTGNTGNNLPPCNQNVNLQSLIQIPDSGFNCVQEGVTGSKYYIGQLGNLQYDYVVAPWTSQPLDVCIGFCTGYTGGTTGGKCSGTNWNGKSAQVNFNNCMSQLSSTTCIPPAPVAARGTILYYPFSPTDRICDKR